MNYTEQLLSIESEAQEAMNDIAKENAALTHRAQENLAKRIAAIESEGADNIKRLVQESEKHTAARIAEIQEEFLNKSKSFEKDFRNARKNLRGKIFHDVLHGEL
jgi:DNA anti-recombination protein RmuC